MVNIEDYCDKVCLYKPKQRQRGNISLHGCQPLPFIKNKFAGHPYLYPLIVNTIFIKKKK